MRDTIQHACLFGTYARSCDMSHQVTKVQKGMKVPSAQRRVLCAPIRLVMMSSCAHFAGAPSRRGARRDVPRRRASACRNVTNRLDADIAADERRVRPSASGGDDASGGGSPAAASRESGAICDGSRSRYPRADAYVSSGGRRQTGQARFAIRPPSPHPGEPGHGASPRAWPQPSRSGCRDRQRRGLVEAPADRAATPPTGRAGPGARRPCEP
jgi:hypothetical protein